MNIEHILECTALGNVRILIPDLWPANYGFIILVGEVKKCPVVRIQSRCSYGEVFGSTYCDCKQQLDRSCEMICQEGGLLFYLDQEGRGAGAVSKALAYRAWQKDRVDTFKFYESLGMPADLRNYKPVADALLDMGIDQIRLITDNQTKIDQLESRGIKVERVKINIVSCDGNASYIAAKRSRGYLE